MRNLIANAWICIDQGDLNGAGILLEESKTLALNYRDRKNLAKTLFVYARLFALQSDHANARRNLADATELFERLGMRRELAEAREELRRINEMGEAPAA